MHLSRPKNLNLFTIRFPIPAIVSILHRISGAVLFLLIPIMLWLFQLSLTYDGFDSIHQYLDNGCVKCVVWLCLAALLYHFVAGIRHLLADIHVGATLRGGRRGAMVVFIVSGVLIMLAGIWLW